MKFSILLIVITLFTMVGCATTKVNDVFRFEARQLTLTVGESVELKMIMGNIESSEKIVFDISEDNVVKLAGIKSTYIHGDTVIGDCNAMKVMAINEGAIKLTAYLKSNPNVKDTIDIVVSNERIGQMIITSDDLVVDGDYYTMEIGETAHLKASVFPENIDNSVIWQSLNEDIATVDKYGNVTAKYGGVATILAQSKQDSSMNCKIDIHVNYLCAEKLVVSGPLVVQIGEVVKFDATIEPFGADTSSLEWSTTYVYPEGEVKNENEVPGTINANGQFSANRSGEFFIIASVKTYQKDANGNYITQTVENANKEKVEVKKEVVIRGNIKIMVENVPATEVSVEEESIELYFDETKQLKATVLPSNANQKPTWISSDETVVKVSETGLVQAVAPGVATIKVLDEKSGLYDEIAVTIKARPDTTDIKVIVDGEEVSEIVKYIDQATFQLITQVLPENAYNKVTFASSDETVATVDSKGLVSVLSVGNTTITVVSGDGKVTKEIPLTISERPAATGFELYWSFNGEEPEALANNSTINMTIDDEGMFIVKVLPVGAISEIIAVSSDGSVIEVNNDNEGVAGETAELVIYPSDPGTASVTISTLDGSFVVVINFVVAE